MLWYSEIIHSSRIYQSSEGGFPMARRKKKRTIDPIYEDLHRVSLEGALASCLHFPEEGAICQNIPIHYHDFVEIIYCIKGRFTAKMSNREVMLSEGDMLLLNINEVHGFYHFEPCEYYCLQFDPTEYFTSPTALIGEKYIIPFLVASSIDKKGNEYTLLAKKEELEGTFIPDVIKNYHDELKEKLPGYELAIRADICRLYLWYLRRMEKNGIFLFGSTDYRQDDLERIKVAIDYVHENYSEPVLARKMADMCNMSYSYFSRFFRHAVGQTFSDYLLYVRLTEAEKLLITTSKSISQIALDTGFSTSSYFITQFKKHRHITPKQLKQKIAAADDARK